MSETKSEENRAQGNPERSRWSGIDLEKDHPFRKYEPYEFPEHKREKPPAKRKKPSVARDMRQ